MNVRRTLKWALAIVLVLGITAFLAFLYFIPPLLLLSPETLSAPVAAAPPPVTGIADPAERAIAERGRYIVTYTGCIGCHATNGSQGPDLTKYLAGGGLKYPVYIVENAHLDAIGFDQNPSLHPGRAPAFYAELGYRLGRRWTLSSYYDSYRFKESPAERVMSACSERAPSKPSARKSHPSRSARSISVSRAQPPLRGMLGGVRSNRARSTSPTLSTSAA